MKHLPSRAVRRLRWLPVLLLAAPAALGQEGLQSYLPDELPWTLRRADPPLAYALLHGDPARPGSFTFRVRARAPHRLPPHTHPDERTITVLSGTYWSGVGERFDAAALVAYPAGSFYTVPAGLPHFSAVLEGETVFQESGIGPSGNRPVDAAAP